MFVFRVWSYGHTLSSQYRDESIFYYVKHNKHNNGIRLSSKRSTQNWVNLNPLSVSSDILKLHWSHTAVYRGTWPLISSWTEPYSPVCLASKTYWPIPPKTFANFRTRPRHVVLKFKLWRLIVPRRSNIFQVIELFSPHMLFVWFTIVVICLSARHDRLR